MRVGLRPSGTEPRIEGVRTATMSDRASPTCYQSCVNLVPSLSPIGHDAQQPSRSVHDCVKPTSGFGDRLANLPFWSRKVVVELVRRRTARPHGAVTWLLTVAGVVVIAGVLVLWVLPSLLTRQPSAGLSTSERLRAVNDARGSLITFLVVVGTAGTLFFTARTFALNRAGQVTDRYTRAIDQIGAAALETRIGGIYALERIGRDSPDDRPTVIYVLGAFVRSQSRRERASDAEPAEDVYAALRVVSRLAPSADVVVNLRGAGLRNAQLRFMRSVHVHLDGSDVAGALLPDSWSATFEPAERSPDSGDPESRSHHTAP
jgi:hypothetical protein